MKQTSFKRFGLMIDMSRDAVMTVDAVKKTADLMAKMGYNTLMLYTEDTYEIEGEPYFGYLRGRYSEKELSEIVAYCETLGIEVIPCIQTLAHLDAIMRWPEYAKICDFRNILLVEDERTYTLIDRMLKQVKKVFKTKKIHIGMDEAHMLGLGKYLDRHGYHNRFDLLTAHLKKVVEMVKACGLEPIMWSDMFFRLGNHGVYSLDDPQIPEDLPQKIHPDVALTYWEYFSADPKRYDAMFRAHQKLGREIWFAGGAWTWTGFAPHNRFSVHATKAALESCRKYGVENVILTLWGDDGGECSRFSVLPALYASAEFARGNFDMPSIRQGFEAEFGIPYEAFCDLDLWANEAKGDAAEAITNPDKYLLYADPFLGMTDSTLRGGEGEKYKDCAEKLSPYVAHETYGPLFRSLRDLSLVLEKKAELGLKLRRTYQAGDKAELKKLAADLRIAKSRTEDFLRSLRAVWTAENKPHAFAVQELRLGGLIARLESCANRVKDFTEGKIDSIPELEEKILDYKGHFEDLQKKPIRTRRYQNVASPDILFIPGNPAASE